MRSNYISKYESLKKIAYETSPEREKTKRNMDNSKMVHTDDVQKLIKQKSGGYAIPQDDNIPSGAYGNFRKLNINPPSRYVGDEEDTPV